MILLFLPKQNIEFSIIFYCINIRVVFMENLCSLLFSSNIANIQRRTVCLFFFSLTYVINKEIIDGGENLCLIFIRRNLSGFVENDELIKIRKKIFVSYFF
jgi:hypothetical protein